MRIQESLAAVVVLSITLSSMEIEKKSLNVVVEALAKLLVLSTSGGATTHLNALSNTRRSYLYSLAWIPVATC